MMNYLLGLNQHGRIQSPVSGEMSVCIETASAKMPVPGNYF